ncbi:MAG: hypothetical protein ACYCST_15555 [Acidimicrobiales bacterium]
MTVLTLESALVAAIVLVVVALLSVAFASRPASAIPFVLLVELGIASSVTPAIMVGNLHVYPGDILTVALMAATLMRWQQRGDGLRAPRPLVVFMAILLLSTLRGVAAFGLQPSIVDAREMLSMLTAAVFFSTVRFTPQLVRVVRNCLLLASGVLLVIAVDFWLQHGFGTYAATGARALDALQALILLETTIFTILFPPLRGPVLRWVVPMAGFVLVVLSIQRTVWAATLVAVAVLVVVRQRSSGATAVAGRRVVVVAAVLAVLLLVAAGPSGVTSSLTAGYQQTSITQNSTLNWRLQGWSALIHRQIAGPLADLVVGSPSGTGSARAIDGSIVTVAAHSEYVSTLDKVGILGLALLVWVYMTALRKARRRLHSPSPFVGQAALLITVLLDLQLTYLVAYSEGWLVGLMLGLACGFVDGSDRDSTVDQSQHLPAATAERP